MKAAEIRTSLVPQSTSLSTIRMLVGALSKGERAIKRLNFSLRRMCYAKNACEALGLIDREANVTALGLALLAKPTGSTDEAQIFRRAIENSSILTKIAPDPFSSPLDKGAVARRIQRLYGFSDSTARDRASNLASWVKQISEACPTHNPAPARDESSPNGERREVRRRAPTIEPLSAAGASRGPTSTRPKKASEPADTQQRTRRARNSRRTPPPPVPAESAIRGSESSKQTERPNIIPKLILPRRYETLRTESEKAQVDLFSIVQRVETAAQRIDYLLRKVREGGTGLFEVFFGASGSGKTTFLQTLPKFFDRVHVTPVARADGTLDDFVARVEAEHETVRDRLRIYFFADRDNENLDDATAERFFEALRVLFRKKSGQVLVIWPVTRPETRNQLASKAWSIGADSIVSVDSRGTYEFKGVPQSQFFEVADVTALSLNGESLEGYGVSREVGERLARDSATISIYFGELEEFASRRRQEVWSVLKERVRPRLWVVLAGDLGDYLDLTVSRLTQGRKYRIDIERLLEFLDDAENDSLYFQEWREQRANAAHLFRILDVRLIPLHPGGAVAAVRGFGSESIRKRLKRDATPEKEAITAVHRTLLYKLIAKELGGSPEPYSKGRSPSKETIDEYKRMQSLAKSGDKGLNHAIAEALRASLEFDGYQVNLRAEKKGLSGTNLQPDTQIQLSEAEVICLETTWRTSGKGITGELDSSQNSMSPGNIQKYILQKVMEYVRALRL